MLVHLACKYKTGEYMKQRILFYWFKGGYKPITIAEKLARVGIKVCSFLTTDTRLHINCMQLTLARERMHVMMAVSN